jgi:hypothetical protein
MTRLICYLFGHAKPHIHGARNYKDGVMHYQCPRCKGQAQR